MPVYDYRCKTCGHVLEVVKPIRELDREELCYVCDDVRELVIRPVAVRGDYPGYNCPVTGQWVEGRKAHEENLRKHGARLLEPGEVERVRKQAQDREKQLDATIEDSVDRFVSDLPAHKREELCNAALDHDVTVTRV